MTVIAITNDNFNAHQGFDIHPPNNAPLPDNHPSIPKEYRLLRSMTVGSLIEMLSEDLGVDKSLVRPWGLVSRQNGTTRPDGPLHTLDSTIEEASHRLQAKIPLRIWVEVASPDDEGKQMHDVATLTDSKSPTTPTLLFLKYFNPKEQSLSGKGHVYVGKHQRIGEIGPIILERMGWEPGTDLKLYEVSSV